MDERKPLILMVEDEQEVLKINARMMKRRGYEVLAAVNCVQAEQYLEQSVPDLLILDIMLPDGDGYEICERFRRKSDYPVIFLTGKNTIDDKIEGLDKGGDYYLTKPYDLEELLAVTKRLLERHMQAKRKQQKSETIIRNGLVLDIPNGKAFLNEKDTGLTAKEFALLHLLIQNENQEMTLQALYETVWGASAGNDIRTVRVHIGNLRRKIDADHSNDYDIVAVYGKGYMFTTIT